MEEGENLLTEQRDLDCNAIETLLMKKTTEVSRGKYLLLHLRLTRNFLYKEKETWGSEGCLI